MNRFRTVILPIVGGLLVGGWLFLKWDSYRLGRVQLNLLLERTGLRLEGPYQIEDYEHEEDFGDLWYRFEIRLPEDALFEEFSSTKTRWGTWKRQGDKYEFYCTHAEYHSDRIFATYDPRTRELSLHLIHI